MPRDCRIYLEDILDATRKIRAYTKGLSKTAFLQDDKTFDAVVRNLEIIGEAAKNIPDTVRVDTPGIEWKLGRTLQRKPVGAGERREPKRKSYSLVSNRVRPRSSMAQPNQPLYPDALSLLG